MQQGLAPLAFPPNFLFTSHLTLVPKGHLILEASGDGRCLGRCKVEKSRPIP